MYKPTFSLFVYFGLITTELIKKHPNSCSVCNLSKSIFLQKSVHEDLGQMWLDLQFSFHQEIENSSNILGCSVYL